MYFLMISLVLSFFMVGVSPTNKKPDVYMMLNSEKDLKKIETEKDFFSPENILSFKVNLGVLKKLTLDALNTIYDNGSGEGGILKQNFYQHLNEEKNFEIMDASNGKTTIGDIKASLKDNQAVFYKIKRGKNRFNLYIIPNLFDKNTNFYDFFLKNENALNLYNKLKEETNLKGFFTFIVQVFNTSLPLYQEIKEVKGSVSQFEVWFKSIYNPINNIIENTQKLTSLTDFTSEGNRKVLLDCLKEYSDQNLLKFVEDLTKDPEMQKINLKSILDANLQDLLEIVVGKLKTKENAQSLIDFLKDKKNDLNNGIFNEFIAELEKFPAAAVIIPPAGSKKTFTVIEKTPEEVREEKEKKKEEEENKKKVKTREYSAVLKEDFANMLKAKNIDPVTGFKIPPAGDPNAGSDAGSSSTVPPSVSSSIVPLDSAVVSEEELEKKKTEYVDSLKKYFKNVHEMLENDSLKKDSPECVALKAFLDGKEEENFLEAIFLSFDSEADIKKGFEDLLKECTDLENKVFFNFGEFDRNVILDEAGKKTIFDNWVAFWKGISEAKEVKDKATLIEYNKFQSYLILYTKPGNTEFDNIKNSADFFKDLEEYNEGMIKLYRTLSSVSAPAAPAGIAGDAGSTSGKSPAATGSASGKSSVVTGAAATGKGAVLDSKDALKNKQYKKFTDLIAQFNKSLENKNAKKDLPEYEALEKYITPFLENSGKNEFDKIYNIDNSIFESSLNNITVELKRLDENLVKAKEVSKPSLNLKDIPKDVKNLVDDKGENGKESFFKRNPKTSVFSLLAIAGSAGALGAYLYRKKSAAAA